MVEKANTRLISFCVKAIIAAKRAENAPTQATKFNAKPSSTKYYIGNNLATKNTPATTIVAA